MTCLLYTSAAADEGLGVDLGGRRIIKNINYFVEKYNRVCLGVSNKRFSSKLFKNISDNELTIVSSTISSFASYAGVEFLRVHEIEPNLDAIEVSWKTFMS